MPPKAKKEGKDKKAKRQKKDPNAPKKGLTAFLHYVRDNVSACKEENPEVQHKDLISKLSEKWRNLDQEAKQPYEEKAKLDREKYLKAKEEYEKILKEKEEMNGSNDNQDKEEEEEPKKKQKKSSENNEV